MQTLLRPHFRKYHQVRGDRFRERPQRPESDLGHLIVWQRQWSKPLANLEQEYLQLVGLRPDLLRKEVRHRQEELGLTEMQSESHIQTPNPTFLTGFFAMEHMIQRLKPIPSTTE